MMFYHEGRLDTGYGEKRKEELDLSGHSVACTTGVLTARWSFRIALELFRM